MEQLGRDILESPRPLAASARASTGDSAGGMQKTAAAAAATPVQYPPGRSHAPLQQFPIGALMERVAVDVVGPLPHSEKVR